MNKEENKTDKLGASNAFSMGPRGCIGRKYGHVLRTIKR